MSSYDKVPYYDKEFNSLVKISSKTFTTEPFRKDKSLIYSETLIDMFLDDISKTRPIYFIESSSFLSIMGIYKTYEEAILSLTSNIYSSLIINNICYIDDSILVTFYNDEKVNSDVYWTELRDNKFNKLLDDL